MHDDAFLATFIAGGIEPRDFDHRAHLRAAWCALRRHPFLEACIVMRDGLGRVAQKAGKPGLYHETVTVAYMALIGACMDEPIAAWTALIDLHPELLDHGLLARYYHPATLASATARSRFVLPDLHASTTDDQSHPSAPFAP